MMESVHALEHLPELTGDISNALARANRDLLYSGWSRLLDRRQSFPDTLLLGPIKMTLRFWLTRETKSRLLFFFAKQSFQVVIDAEIEMDLVFSDRSLDLATALSSQTRYRLTVPDFIDPGLSPERVAAFTGLIARPKPTGANAVLFKIGADADSVIAVVLTGMKRGRPRARFQYTPSSGETRLLERGADGAWPVPPFLALIQALARWSLDEPNRRQTIPVSLSQAEDRSDIAKILETLADAHHRLNLNLNASNKAFPSGSLQDQLLPGLQTRDFYARLVLRLDEQGNLSDSNDNQVFHLTLNANFDLEESGPIPRIVLGIPDFLVVSELKSVLLAPFENGPGFDELSRKLNESETGRQLKRLGHDLTGPLLESFLDQAKQRAVVFRTDRKKGDAAKKSVNIFVLSGSLAGAAQTLIFRATLVSTGQLRARAARTLERGSLKILFFGAPGPDSTGLDDEAIDYFARMANTVRRLLGVVQ